jgi:hypothetical protein
MTLGESMWVRWARIVSGAGILLFICGKEQQTCESLDLDSGFTMHIGLELLQYKFVTRLAFYFQSYKQTVGRNRAHTIAPGIAKSIYN